MAVNAGEPVRRQRPKKRQQTVAFQYDDADRQTKVTYTSGMSVSTTYTDAGEVKSLKYAKADRSLIAQGGYTYDLAGRRIGVSGDLANFVSTQGSDISDASFNAANQLLTWNGKSFSYDANGNMPSDGSTTYQWDERDQLVGITSTTTNASFKYDSDGRRIARTLGPTTTAYNFDGDNFIQELDAVGRTGNITANLLTGGIDQHFMRQTTVNGQPSLSWVMSEANNSTVVQTDGSGNVQKAFQYTPYGSPAATTGTSTDSQRYTGREDDGTGLYYYRARYYRPDCMRFISEDPIGWASGQTNNYAYVRGNPMSWRDPTGLFGFVEHEAITNEALGKNSKCSNIGRMVSDVDRLAHSQEPVNSYWHAMSDGTTKQTVAEAENLFNQYVKENVEAGTMEGLARALHAVQDSAAAGHRGFQPWGGGVPGPRHLRGDIMPSKRSWDEAVTKSKEVLGQSIAASACQ